MRCDSRTRLPAVIILFIDSLTRSLSHLLTRTLIRSLTDSPLDPLCFLSQGAAEAALNALVLHQEGEEGTGGETKILSDYVRVCRQAGSIENIAETMRSVCKRKEELFGGSAGGQALLGRLLEASVGALHHYEDPSSYKEREGVLRELLGLYPANTHPIRHAR